MIAAILAALVSLSTPQGECLGAGAYPAPDDPQRVTYVVVDGDCVIPTARGMSATQVCELAAELSLECEAAS